MDRPAAMVEPIRKNDAPFFVGDCLPGAIDAHDAPSAQDDEGAATMTVFTCRSRSSATNILLVYLLAALSYPAYRLLIRRCARLRGAGFGAEAPGRERSSYVRSMKRVTWEMTASGASSRQ